MTENLTLGIVLGAAAVDSINPCTIGVLLFLSSVLLNVSSDKETLLRLGTVYILTVYVVYTLSGLGLIWFQHFLIWRGFAEMVGIIQNSSTESTPAALSAQNPLDPLVAFARCLTEKGTVLYSSITCSACRAQRKAFSPAFTLITEVECNPHAENTQVDRCLARKIKITPTWIAEENGDEVRRVEGYQLLEDLAAFAGCDYSS